jgi:hemoglobin-like flavoprotein
MTPEQKELIRRSWPLVREQSDAATVLFYERLFTINPSARRLFRDKDMRLQGTAFIQMVAMFVRSLDDDDPVIAEGIDACGRRHVGYGVRYSDYEPAGRALLWALEQSLGPLFTNEVRDAWEAAYRSLAATMRPVSSAVV